MSDKARLDIRIGPDGEVNIVTHGLTGQACLEETRDLEKAVGKVKKREKTREFYLQAQRTTNKVRN
jgi:hypothetical protein